MMYTDNTERHSIRLNYEVSCEGESIDYGFMFLYPIYTYKPGSIRFAKYLEIGGSPYNFESVKISGSDEGVLREGVGDKKV